VPTGVAEPDFSRHFDSSDDPMIRLAMTSRTATTQPYCRSDVQARSNGLP